MVGMSEFVGVLVRECADLLSVHDPEGVYLFASAGFERELGYPPSELLGRSAYELFHPRDREAILASHLAVLGPVRAYAVQYRIRAADGQFRWVETTSRLVPPSVDRGAVIVASTRPIDDRIGLQQALSAYRDLAAHAAEMDDVRAALLSAVSHELRTPLTTVVGSAATLARHGEQLDPAQRTLLTGRLHAAATRLEQRLLETVSAGRLLSGSVRASRRPVRLRRLVQELLADLRLDRPVTIAVGPDGTVLVDPEHLRQILVVLLGNAAKHTPPGTAITVRLEQTPEASTVIVEDEGPGVPVDRRDEIFAPFGRWRTPEGQPGLGLGLFVVAGLVKAHSGTAWVEDRAGGGSSFRVAFPTQAAVTSSWSPPTATVTLDLRDTDAPSAWSGRPRILVVDDDEAVRDTVRVVLELEGFDVDTTGSGLAAIELAARRHPQVAVLDVLLPDVDGWAVAERLLSDDGATQTAVVFCTAASGAASRERARRLGAAGLIGKPFNPERLVRLVVGLVRSQIAAVGGVVSVREDPNTAS